MNDWFRSYLDDHHQKVRIHDKLSHSKLISHGVPQGSTLGSLLFLIHIHNVFTDLQYEIILYTDNATVLVHAKSLPDAFTAANEYLVKVYNNLLGSKLILNIAKSKFMILTPQPHRLVRNPDQVLSINNIPILEANNF